jgi:hypothetical protein
MNAGGLLVLIQLLKDIEISGGLIGPPGPNGNGNGETLKVKPNCGPGSYATQTAQGYWVCVPIPKGR